MTAIRALANRGLTSKPECQSVPNGMAELLTMYRILQNQGEEMPKECLPSYDCPVPDRPKSWTKNEESSNSHRPVIPGIVKHVQGDLAIGLAYGMLLWSEKLAPYGFPCLPHGEIGRLRGVSRCTNTRTPIRLTVNKTIEASGHPELVMSNLVEFVKLTQLSQKNIRDFNGVSSYAGRLIRAIQDMTDFFRQENDIRLKPKCFGESNSNDKFSWSFDVISGAVNPTTGARFQVTLSLEIGEKYCQIDHQSRGVLTRLIEWSARTLNCNRRPRTDFTTSCRHDIRGDEFPCFYILGHGLHDYNSMVKLLGPCDKTPDVDASPGSMEDTDDMGFRGGVPVLGMFLSCLLEPRCVRQSHFVITSTKHFLSLADVLTGQV